MPFAVMEIAASSLAKGSTRSVGVEGVQSRANIITVSTPARSPMTDLWPSHMLTVPRRWLEPSHQREVQFAGTRHICSAVLHTQCGSAVNMVGCG